MIIIITVITIMIIIIMITIIIAIKYQLIIMNAFIRQVLEVLY